MKLTLFGEAARQLRMRLDLSMKDMAEGMGVSSSHLSGLEYGEKRLAEKHIASALAFLKAKGASTTELNAVLDAAERSKDAISTSSLNPDAKGLVAAFARRLQEGDAPTPEIMAWIAKRQKVKK